MQHRSVFIKLLVKWSGFSLILYTSGEIACCNELESASSDIVTDLLGLLGIVLSDVTALVGIGCVGIEGVYVFSFNVLLRYFYLTVALLSSVGLVVLVVNK